MFILAIIPFIDVLLPSDPFRRFVIFMIIIIIECVPKVIIIIGMHNKILRGGEGRSSKMGVVRGGVLGMDLIKVIIVVIMFHVGSLIVVILIVIVFQSVSVGSNRIKLMIVIVFHVVSL